MQRDLQVSRRGPQLLDGGKQRGHVLGRIPRPPEVQVLEHARQRRVDGRRGRHLDQVPQQRSEEGVGRLLRAGRARGEVRERRRERGAECLDSVAHQVVGPRLVVADELDELVESIFGSSNRSLHALERLARDLVRLPVECRVDLIGSDAQLRKLARERQYRAPLLLVLGQVERDQVGGGIGSNLRQLLKRALKLGVVRDQPLDAVALGLDRLLLLAGYSLGLRCVELGLREILVGLDQFLKRPRLVAGNRHFGYLRLQALELAV